MSVHKPFISPAACSMHLLPLRFRKQSEHRTTVCEAFGFHEGLQACRPIPVYAKKPCGFFDDALMG